MLPVGANIPPNFIKPDRDAYIPDLINASDVLLGKLGYGTTSEAIHQTRGGGVVGLSVSGWGAVMAGDRAQQAVYLYPAELFQ